MAGSSLPTRALTPAELIAIDCLAATLLSGAYLALALPRALPSVNAGQPTWLVSSLIVLAMALPIAVRRLWPMSVFVVVTAVSALAVALDVLREPFIAAALAGYTAAVTERRLSRRGWTFVGSASLILILLSVSAGMARSWAEPLSAIVPGLALVGAAWTMGAAVRERRGYAARSAEERMARAVADERLRIAREVHDIVTHNLGIITVKAAVARHVAQSQPGEALESLRMIEEVGRSALTDMRQVLHVLRTAPRDSDDELTVELLPGVRDLPALRRRTAAAGLDLRWEVSGVEDLPEGTAVSTYRIVQEALTNVLKHAGPTRCRVSVRCANDGVVIDVADDGAPDHRPVIRTAAGAGGHGLLGMRERVAMHGGELQTGPRAGGGYRVRARLPYRTDDKPFGSSA